MNTNSKYSTFYLPAIPEDLREHVFNLCKSNAFAEALRLLHNSGFRQYDDNAVRSFYHDTIAPLTPRPLPEPENPNALPSTTTNPANKRRSKIAHLPKDIRNHLNTMLDDGATYAQIIAWLNEQGHTGITKQNLSDWQRAGYQDWIRETVRKESHVVQREWFFDRLADTDSDQVLPLMDKLFVSEFLDTIFGLDTQSLKERLATSPRDFIALFNAYRRLKHDLLDSKSQKPPEPSSLVQPGPSLVAPKELSPHQS